MNINLAPYANKRICIAVSGGKDSMALLHFIHAHGGEYGINVCALNCDHKIRGIVSARDSAFVRGWCKDNGIPLLFFKWNWDFNKTESLARLWRLKCYASAASDGLGCSGVKASAVYSEDGLWHGADAVATAHHLNDNAETVLFNLARGSALAGMEGITDGRFPAEGVGYLNIIHPMISTSREEIDLYIKENNIPFVEDESNFTDEYTRNRIRHNVLPELEKAVPGAAKAIYRFSRLAADDEEYFDNVIRERGLIKNTRLGCEILFCGQKVVFKRAVIKALAVYNIKDYTSEHAQRLYELQFAEKGKKFEFLGFTAFKEDGRICICDTNLLQTTIQGMPYNEHVGCEFAFWNNIFICVSDERLLEDKLMAFEAAADDDDRIPKKFKVLKFDGDKIPDGAVIRSMHDGDKFTKFGGGTKNLGDYFTDKKIPVRLRPQIPLIAMENKVLAVCGVEISDKIKITDKTQNVKCIICADYTKV